MWLYVLHLRILTLSSKSLQVIWLPKAMAHYTCSTVFAANSLYGCECCEGAKDGEWWEHSPHTNVVRFHVDLTPYVGWVCFRFPPLLKEVFSGFFRVSPLLKTTVKFSSAMSHHQLLISPWAHSYDFSCRSRQENVLFYQRRGKKELMEKRVHTGKRGGPYLPWNLIDKFWWYEVVS